MNGRHLQNPTDLSLFHLRSVRFLFLAENVGESRRMQRKAETGQNVLGWI